LPPVIQGGKQSLRRLIPPTVPGVVAGEKAGADFSQK